MVELMKNCVERNDDQAWTELWLVFERVAARPLRRLVAEFGYSAADADDAVMHVWQRLFANGMRRLGTFRGTTMKELEGWLVRVATNSTLRWLRKEKRQRGAAEIPLSQRDVADHRGPAESEIRALLDELEETGRAGDARRLRILAGLETPPEQISDRTLRYWSQKLSRLYGDVFRDLQ